MAHFHADQSLAERRALNSRRMWWALAINAALLVATVVGGIVTGSLALLADAGHLLSDVGAIAVGLVAARLATMAPTPTRTFGYQRSEVLGALVNGVALLAIAALITAGAIGRLGHPPDVAAGGVLALGLLGLAGNVLATWVLASGERADLNLEAVLRHSAADALSSLAVVCAGALVLATGEQIVDPLATLVIAALIAAGSWRLLSEPVAVLMEAAPRGVDVRRLGTEIVADEDVVELHDLHVWTVTSGFPALSAHIVVKSGSDRDRVRERVEHLLDARFDVHHTTLQVVEAATAEELIAVEDVGRATR